MERGKGKREKLEEKKAKKKILWKKESWNITYNLFHSLVTKNWNDQSTVFR